MSKFYDEMLEATSYNTALSHSFVEWYARYRLYQEFWYANMNVATNLTESIKAMAALSPQPRPKPTKGDDAKPKSEDTPDA